MYYAPTIPLVILEASDAEDKAYLRSMDKQDIKQLNAEYMQRLYKSALERNTCDFGEIPNSRGDITKLKCYPPTKECLDILEELLSKNRVTVPAISDVKTAIANIITLRTQFMAGFNLGQDYIILTYNTMVMAVLDAVNMLIAEYMNYLTGPSKEPFKLSGKTDKSRGLVSLDILRSFNKLVADNTLINTFSNLTSGKNNFTGMAIPFAIIGGLIAVLTLTRQAILYFYQSRVKLSDYLEMEASFLEANKLSVEASKLSDEKKTKVLMKQEKVILKMRRLADRLKINNEDAGRAAKEAEKKENSGWSLKSIEKDMANKKMDGEMSINIV